MKETIRAIDELKAEKLIEDYAIGGGIAAIFYIEPILTYDLDVFIIPSEKGKEGDVIVLSPVYDHLKSKGYGWQGEHIVIEGLPVQFIPADELEEEAVRNAREIEYEGVKTRVLTAEYLVSILLRAGRRKDMEKIDKLMEQAELDMEQLKKILGRHGLGGKLELP